MRTIAEKIQWQTSVSIFKNSLILKQLGLAVGIPFGTLLLLLILVSKKDIYTIYAVSMVSLPLIITWIFIMVVYGGKYEVEFILDSDGIFSQTQQKQRKKNRILNILTISLGLFSKSLSSAGAGLLAESRQQVFIPWKQITQVNYNLKTKTILIKSGVMDSVALFCSDDNYDKVREFIALKIRK